VVGHDGKHGLEGSDLFRSGLGLSKPLFCVKILGRKVCRHLSFFLHLILIGAGDNLLPKNTCSRPRIQGSKIMRCPQIAYFLKSDGTVFPPAGVASTYREVVLNKLFFCKLLSTTNLHKKCGKLVDYSTSTPH
jgi:hypothetical protein